MHKSIIIPVAVVVALACYYTALFCSGRMFNALRANGRWVYRSEQPKVFWASTLQYAVGFATIFFLFYNYSFHNDNFVAKVTAAVTGFTLAGFIYFWGVRES
jgi:hypothetical protein